MTYNENDLKELAKRGFQFALAYAIAIMILLFLAAVCGCSPRVIEHEIIRTDTLVVNNWQRDSIYLEVVKHDSISVKEKGDTLLIEKWHTQWRDRWRDKLIHDSIYIAKTDTLLVTKTIEKTQKISGWKWFQIWTGRLCLIIGGGLLAFYIYRKKLLHK